jgi:hypothetical protein
MNNQLEQIGMAVRNYLSKNTVKLVIATPCFGGMLHNGYFQSILDLAVNFTRLNIPFEVMTIGNESLIQRARNGIVAKFMSDESATHLMFIDADITFSWVSIVKLLLSNKELSGGCYPKKCFNWDKIKHHSTKSPNLSDDELMAKSLDYVFNPIYHQEGANVVIKLENGMASVKDIGTGFMMIKRSVIKKMMSKFPDTKYRNNVAGYGQNNMNDYFYALFECAIDPVSKVYLSEDYLFCKRWIDIGGELWLDLNTNLNHTGIIDYKGCLGITVGEVDVLNKDAQIMRAQMEKEVAQKKTLEDKNKNPTPAPTTPTSSSLTQTEQTNTSNKKKKNKKKNKKNKNIVGNNSNELVKDNESSSEEDENELIISSQEPKSDFQLPYKCDHC